MRSRRRGRPLLPRDLLLAKGRLDAPSAGHGLFRGHGKFGENRPLLEHGASLLRIDGPSALGLQGVPPFSTNRRPGLEP